MIKNQLVDSEFNYPKHTWIIDNARIRGTNPFFISSSNKSYGIHQTLYLSNSGRYYFRIDIKALKYIKEVIIGISVDGNMKASKYYVPVNLFRSISVIVDVHDPDKPVTLYVIAVNRGEGSEIVLSKPVLYRLEDIWQKFALKSYLDKKLEYNKSYSYDNILATACFPFNSIRYKQSVRTKISPVKQGEIAVETKELVNIYRYCNLIENHKYLVKILKEEVNSQGQFSIVCNEEKSKPLSKYQEYLTFIYDGVNKPRIRCQCKQGSKVPYRVILKRMLVADITDIEFTEEEIKSLLFVE